MQKCHEFVTPRSVLTPGAGGGLSMAITTTLAARFILPYRWLGPVVSGFFAAAVVKYAQMRLAERALFGALSTLNTFFVAFATGTFGTGVASSEARVLLLGLDTSIGWVVPSTVAQPVSTQSSMPDGELIKGSGPDLNLIDQGKRCLVRDQKTRIAAGLQSKSVTTVTNSRSPAITRGNTV